MSDGADVATALADVAGKLGSVCDVLERLSTEWAAAKVEIARSNAVQQAWQDAAKELCRLGAAAAGSRAGQGFAVSVGVAVLIRLLGMDAITAAQLAFAWWGIPWPLTTP